jgi:hypothetical protein
MNIKSLKQHIQRRRCLRLTLRSPADRHVRGIPVDFGKAYWLLQGITEFHLDGYVAVPVWNIQSVRSGKYERAIDRVLKGEGVSRSVSTPPGIGLNSPDGLFEDLFSRQHLSWLKGCLGNLAAHPTKKCF